MKKLMLILSVATLLAMPMTDATAQSHRHTPRTKAKVTVKADKDSASVGIEAFSDTTSSVADAEPIDEAFSYGTQTDSDIEDLRNVMDAVGSAAFIPVAIVAVVFIVPAIIIFFICYLIYKNRQQKLKIVEMAIKNGQPIPDSILGYTSRRATENATKTTGTADEPQPASGNKYGIPPMPTNDQLWRKGVMRIFVGIGLMFLLDSMMGSFGFSIGVLVTLYGAGQAFIAWSSRRNANGSYHDYEKPENPDNTTDIENTDNRWER